MTLPSPKAFHLFTTDITSIAIPKKFNYPFYYTPNKLSEIAANLTQSYIAENIELIHDFKSIGKMFGVLVVENQNNQLGYLAAFSGKLANSNNHEYFVPPVFDMLMKDSYFLQEEEVINSINSAIEALESDNEFLFLKEQLLQQELQYAKELLQHKQLMSQSKAHRKQIKLTKEPLLNELDFLALCHQLNEESVQQKITLKQLNYYWKNKIATQTSLLNEYVVKIENLKELRKEKSNHLQNYLFNQYRFLNANGKSSSLLELFNNNPPAGAGECAGPKLLHYAYIHQLKPISMAEFWWGAPPKSEIRKHLHFYPACQSKCAPILAHMLQGLNVEKNPLLVNPAANKDLPIVYEDEYLLAVNKPAEFLSVPGKNISDSVYTRIKEKYPEATGPLVVHRLDMSTSGLLLIAKSTEIYHHLQSQFIKRTIQKRYVALLDGKLAENEGFIELPLRVDLEDRPKQLVCYEHGKKAITKWAKISSTNTQTKVYFYPYTGRTHQLRVHAAHPKGLNAPIVGDDLYGNKANRLHLHAEQLIFTHPITKKTITLNVPATF